MLGRRAGDISYGWLLFVAADIIPPRAISNMWRFRGSPYYLGTQARRLGVSQEFVHVSRHNAEIYRVHTLTNALSECWHGMRKEDGIPVLSPGERDRIKGTLGRVEIEVQKLHVLAAAADQMLAEARAAFGLEQPGQRFAVILEPDTNILPLGDGTVGIADGELEPAFSKGG